MQLHIDLLEDSVEDLKNKLNKSLELTKNARKKCKTESETSEKYLQEIKDEKEINKALVERIQQLTYRSKINKDSTNFNSVSQITNADAQSQHINSKAEERPVERHGSREREKVQESGANHGEKSGRILTVEPGNRRKLASSASVNNINTTVSINQNLIQ